MVKLFSAKSSPCWLDTFTSTKDVFFVDDGDNNKVTDLAVGVVDDGKEHVEEDEEDKEDVGEEKDGTKNTIRLEI